MTAATGPFRLPLRPALARSGATLLCGALAALPAAAACDLAALPPGQAIEAIDGRTLRLADGRDVRLAGIEVPAAATARGREAKFFLAELAAGERVALRAAASDPADRYGRIHAHVFIVGEGLDRSLQDAMLESGLARVAARVGSYACATAFWAREQNARTARRGLWADPEATLSAERPSDILAMRGRFAAIEGTALSVRESGGTIYVNFGRRWSESFAVTIAKRNVRMFGRAGLDPQRLAGRKLRIRGVVESPAGSVAPRIDAALPEQIEVVGAAPAGVGTADAD